LTALLLMSFPKADATYAGQANYQTSSCTGPMNGWNLYPTGVCLPFGNGVAGASFSVLNCNSTFVTQTTCSDNACTLGCSTVKTFAVGCTGIAGAGGTDSFSCQASLPPIPAGYSSLNINPSGACPGPYVTLYAPMSGGCSKFSNIGYASLQSCSNITNQVQLTNCSHDSTCTNCYNTVLLTATSCNVGLQINSLVCAVPTSSTGGYGPGSNAFHAASASLSCVVVIASVILSVLAVALPSTN